MFTHVRSSLAVLAYTMLIACALTACSRETRAPAPRSNARMPPPPASPVPSRSFPGLTLQNDLPIVDSPEQYARLAALEPHDPETRARMTAITEKLTAFARQTCELVPLNDSHGGRTQLLGFPSPECAAAFGELDSDDVASVHAFGRFLFRERRGSIEGSCGRSINDTERLGLCEASTSHGIVYFMLLTPKLAAAEPPSGVPLFARRRCAMHGGHTGEMVCEPEPRSVQPPYFASPISPNPWIERLPSAGLAASYAALAMDRNVGGFQIASQNLLTVACQFEPPMRWSAFLARHENDDAATLLRATRAVVETHLRSNAIGLFQWAVMQRFDSYFESDRGYSQPRTLAALDARDRFLAFLRVEHGDNFTANQAQYELATMTPGSSELLTESERAAYERWLGSEQSRTDRND